MGLIAYNVICWQATKWLLEPLHRETCSPRARRFRCKPHQNNEGGKSLSMFDKQSIAIVNSSDFMALNAAPSKNSLSRLADVFEHSPWVAQRVGHLRPFSSRSQLHHAMVSAVQQASTTEQPCPCAPTQHWQERRRSKVRSRRPRSKMVARAGLNALSPAEMKCITGLNAACLGRHGFPFIACVGLHTKQGLILEFGRRLGNSTESEVQEALSQIYAIAQLRLITLFAS